MSALSTLQAAGAFIVLAEALNKIDRSDLFDGQGGMRARLGGLCQLATPWRWKRARVVHVLKVLGWAVLSFGAADALISPPAVPTAAVLVGFALLIVRSRLKESS